MTKAKSSFIVEHFFTQLKSAGDCALVVDYDNVLAPFSLNTNNKFPSITAMQLVDNIVVNCRTRVVMVTTQKARDLLRTFRVLPRPEIWGRSGAERLHTNDQFQVFSINDEIERAFLTISSFLERDGLASLTTLDPGSIKVDWSELSEPYAREARACALRTLAFLRGSAGIYVRETPNSIEAACRTSHLPRLLQILTDELSLNAPFACLGSETCEACNFRALPDHSLSILVSPVFSDTRADAWLRPPDQLIEFLAEWIRVRGGKL